MVSRKGTAPTVLMGGLVLLIEHLFRGWPFRKLYFECPEYNLEQFASAVPKILTEEARFREYVYYNERYWDLLMLSLTRETWKLQREKWLRLVQPQGKQEVEGS